MRRLPAERVTVAMAPGAACAAEHDGRIRHVIDTAFWTAGIRAMEQERAVPAYADPYAAGLAGEKGRRIALRLAHATELSWGVSMRTVSIDHLVLQEIACGVDSVLSIGAGLDTRPYRLDIPEHVLWVEADLPEIIEFKNAMLADQVPRCRLERVAANLESASGRRRMLSRIAGGSRNALVIAEGVLPYLLAQEVAALASEVHEETLATRWIVDYDAGGLDWAQGCKSALRAVPRRFQFPHILAFLRFSGWEAVAQVGAGEEARRLGRPYPLGFPRRLLWQVLPVTLKAHIENSSGVALLRKV